MVFLGGSISQISAFRHSDEVNLAIDQNPFAIVLPQNAHWKYAPLVSACLYAGNAIALRIPPFNNLPALIKLCKREKDASWAAGIAELLGFFVLPWIIMKQFTITSYFDSAEKITNSMGEIFCRQKFENFNQLETALRTGLSTERSLILKVNYVADLHAILSKKLHSLSLARYYLETILPKATKNGEFAEEKIQALLTRIDEACEIIRHNQVLCENHEKFREQIDRHTQTQNMLKLAAAIAAAVGMAIEFRYKHSHHSF